MKLIKWRWVKTKKNLLSLSPYLKGITWNNHPLASIFYGFFNWFLGNTTRVPVGSQAPLPRVPPRWPTSPAPPAAAPRPRARAPQTAPRPRLPRSPARRGMALTKASKRKEQVIFEGKLDENFGKIGHVFILEGSGEILVGFARVSSFLTCLKGHY